MNWTDLFMVILPFLHYVAEEAEALPHSPEIIETLKSLPPLKPTNQLTNQSISNISIKYFLFVAIVKVF